VSDDGDVPFCESRFGNITGFAFRNLLPVPLNEFIKHLESDADGARMMLKEKWIPRASDIVSKRIAKVMTKGGPSNNNGAGGCPVVPPSGGSGTATSSAPVGIRLFDDSRPEDCPPFDTHHPPQFSNDGTSPGIQGGSAVEMEKACEEVVQTISAEKILRAASTLMSRQVRELVDESLVNCLSFFEEYEREEVSSFFLLLLRTFFK
jgi:hypothetical protein